jgi:ferritin
METKNTERRKVTYLSEKVGELFVKQVCHENKNRILYLNAHAWCDVRGLRGNSEYFKKAAEGEKEHSELVFQHLIESNYDFTIPAIEEQDLKVSGETPMEQLKSIHEAAMDREILTTTMIFNICKVAMEEGDYISFNAIQPLVIEQREEENKQGTALDQFEFTQDLIILDDKIKELA